MARGKGRIRLPRGGTLAVANFRVVLSKRQQDSAQRSFAGQVECLCAWRPRSVQVLVYLLYIPLHWKILHEK